MTEHDKKIQKSQPDLVQSVLDAFEKRQLDRIDILVTNAFKQLKGSRFKPDQSICMGLFYLARVQPKIYSQSNNLKELLKSHIKRDGVPTSIKGNKTDFFLPVLAANILLASCDTPEVRATILTRINQWISSNQKLSELVQHLLAILCVRCHDDPETIKTLLEIRQQWFDFLEANFDTYGRVSPALALSMRSSFGEALTSDSFAEVLAFLLKHDPDANGLCLSISRLIVQKPITFEGTLRTCEHKAELISLVSDVFDAYIQHNLADSKSASKSESMDSVIYFNFQSSSQVIALNETVVKALLLFRSMTQTTDSSMQTHKFLNHWISEAKSQKDSTSIIFSDVSLTKSYTINLNLLIKMTESANSLLTELAIHCATPCQLIEMALRFALPTETLDLISTRLQTIGTSQTTKPDLNDMIYIDDLLDHHHENGHKSADQLREFLYSLDTIEQENKTIEQVPEVKIKTEIV